MEKRKYRDRCDTLSDGVAVWGGVFDAVSGFEGKTIVGHLGRHSFSGGMSEADEAKSKPLPFLMDACRRIIRAS